jgi:hypothetical protein
MAIFINNRDKDKADYVLVIINIIKSMEVVSDYKDYKLPEDFIKNINGCFYIKSIISEFFPELEKHLNLNIEKIKNEKFKK